LPSLMVLDFQLSAKGGFWLTTDAGICRMPPESKIGDPCRLLSINRPEDGFQADSLVESSDGRIWVATDRALYRSSADARSLQLANTFPQEHVSAIGPAPDGKLLISTDRAVYLWDGHTTLNLSGPPSKGCGFGQIYAASPHDIWVVGSCHVYRLAGGSGRETPRLEPVSLGRSVEVGRIIRRRDSSLWFTVQPGLQYWEQKPDGSLRHKGTLGAEDGIPYQWVTRIAEDNQGNLWGATEGLGIFRITDTGFRVYGDEDGLGTARIGSIFEDLRGDLCVTTARASETDPQSTLRVWNGERFDRIDFRFDPNFRGWGWGWNQVALQAHDGEWWFQSNGALRRFPSLPLPRSLIGMAPYRIYDSAALGEEEIFRIFEDSRGDLWISTVNPRNELIRWERSSGQFHHWTTADGWPPDAIATAIRESPSGTPWFGTFGDVVRFRHGRFEKLAIPSVPALSVVRDLYIDRAGRIWIATARNGLFRCDNPDAAVPVFRHYTARDGLSSDATRSLTEDNAGFLYLGTVRAVDRINPQAPIGGGNILHFTAADGLPNADQNVAYRDRRGHLWFGTLRGLAEYDPAQPAARPIPDVHISRVRVGGEEIPLPWEGARNFTMNLRSHQTQVEIEYAGVDLRSVASLRYQYRLAGVDAAWSPPSARTSVNYTNIPPGQRAFEVRAVAPDGSVGAGVAAVSMILEAPLWRRPWFLAAAVLFLSAAVYWLYNYRVRYLLAMERLRIRIATDLHDDIGASLTQISLLSEVGSRDPFRNVLGDIAAISRDLVQEMSDIVWAVSPRDDHFDSMVHRMRHFAEDAMADGELVFDISGLPPDLPLPLEYRRPLYLVFKEAVNNVARHARATRMVVLVASRNGSLDLTIEDNGCGFNPASCLNGEGLSSIRRRIQELSGSVGWETAPGRGTRLMARIPLRPRRSLPNWEGYAGRLRG
jgi:ligand-binding sensor domain-containing protein/two-component sensor histidine kinase